MYVVFFYEAFLPVSVFLCIRYATLLSGHISFPIFSIICEAVLPVSD